METVSGQITDFNGRDATVVVDSAPVCARCQAGKGCGAGLFQGSDRKTTIRVAIPAKLVVGVGDEVSLSIGGNDLLRAAVYAYGLPLMVCIGSLAIGQALLGPRSDYAGIGIATIGLLIGIRLSRRLLQRESTCARLVPLVVGANIGRRG